MTNGGTVLAIGDSIINGHGSSMGGVPCLSWAQWIADTLEVPYLRFAEGGASSAAIIERLLPKVSGHFTIAALSVGTNDAMTKVPAADVETNILTILERLSEVADRVIVTTVPTSETVSAIVRRAAAETGALVVETALKGHRQVNPDGVHPTALGQLAIADRAASLLNTPQPSKLARNGGNVKLGSAWWAGHSVSTVKFSTKRLAKRVLR